MVEKLLGFSPQVEEIGSTQELLNKIKIVKGMVGFLSIGAATVENGKSLHVVRVNGIAPSPENVKSGKYKMVHNVYLLQNTATENDVAIQSFHSEFNQIKAGLLTEAGFVIP